MTSGRRFGRQLVLGLCWTFLLAVVAYAAPTITSVVGSTPFGGNVPAITSGTPGDAFVLVIEGSFNPEAFQNLTWVNTVTGQTRTFDRESGVFSTSSTMIFVNIPRVLYATPVSSAQTVRITVNEFVFTGEFRAAPRIASNPGTFTINPPLTSLGPALPAATRGIPYDRPYVTGGTAPYLLGSPPTGIPPDLTISGRTPQNVTGTCTVLGFFTFQPSIRDAWGNTLNPTEGLHCVTAATLATIFPNTVTAGSGGLPVVGGGTNFAAPGTVAAVVVPGSRAVWFPSGTSPSTAPSAGIILDTTVNSTTQITFNVPANRILTPGSATIYVLQPDGQYSNGLPFTISSPAPPPPPPPPPLQIITPSVPSGTVAVSYAAAFAASGGAGGYTFALSGGSLPLGLSVNSDGALFGTPTTAGTYRFTMMVSDAAGASAVRDYVLIIAPPPLTITGTVSDVGLGSAVNVKFGATGGTPPYTFAVSGSIPSGTTFSNATLSGTANSQGTFVFTVAATDSAGVVATKVFTLRVTQPSLAVTGSLGNGQVGVAYAGQVGAIGGVPPYTFSATGLPAGVSFSGAGAASGTPTADGSFSVVVTVTDSTGAKANQTIQVVIAVAALTVTTTALPNGTAGAPYSASLGATGGVPPYVWSVTGLPDGISASREGALSGTPTAPGTSSVAATVTDSKGTSAVKTLPLVVDAPVLSITTASLPGGIVGSAYSARVQAAGGIPPYSFSASGLPAGLSAAADGTISGTPTAAGTANVSVTARDSAGTSVSRSLSLAITLPAAPTVNFTGLPATSNPATQPRVTIGLGSPYPVNVTVVLTLTFAPDSGADDPTVQFSSGGRTAQVTIPAGSTAAPTDLGVQTGTVAGTITITARLTAATQDITPTPIPTRTIRINATAPVLQSVTATRTGTGFNVVITGFASSRELTQAVFTFTAAAGTNLQTTTLTIPIGTLFTQWYQSPQSAPFGSMFTLTQPFTVSGGSTGIASVSVMLVNAVGSSAAVSANLQ